MSARKVAQRVRRRAKEQDLDVHGDDAALLIKAIGDKPAYVFGSSGGAQIGLNLAARQPRQVRALAAHEPPCFVCSLSRRKQSHVNENYTASTAVKAPAPRYRHSWSARAWMTSICRTGHHKPPAAEVSEMFARINGNLDYFFAHGLKPISFYVPCQALRDRPGARIVIGVGHDPRPDCGAHRAAG